MFARALALHEAGELPPAAALYREVIEKDPAHLGALTNLAAVVVAMAGGRDAAALEQAIGLYHEALEIDPGRWEVWNNLGNACREGGRLDDAIGALRRATQLEPSAADAWMNLGTALKDAGEMDESLRAYARAVQLRPAFAPAHSNLLFAMLFHPDCDPVGYRAACEQWGAMHAVPLGASWRGHRNDRDPERRIKVGYIGADFRRHAQSHFTLPLLSHHDGRKYKPVVYSSTFPEDDVSARLRAAVAERGGVWQDVLRLSDEELAGLIRRDGIDVLVDLTMHMAGSRLGVMARRPAPIQVTYLAYPGTTGVRAINYRLTDPHLDSPETSEWYTEASVALPETFWCYDPLSGGVEAGSPPAMEAGYVTFGSLNNFCKVSPWYLRLVTEVMLALPGSRLVLLSPEGSHRERMLAWLPGEVAGRVEFTPYLPRRQYLELHRRIDIVLDPVPVNGHTTSLDALWMGVPVITRVGPTAMGRAGLSQLSNLGLPELIAHTDADYVRIAVELAGDVSRLAELRRTLRERMRRSALMDGPRFTRGFESVLRKLWREWCSA
jgi:predicted O-linked N-acetylglucosamine transferase (SPINDLY family)